MQRYLVAKFAPDVFRMEPRNIGIVLWADGRVAAKFLTGSAAEFVSDKPVYDRWIAFWNRLVSERAVANGTIVTADDPGFLDALMKTQEGNFMLTDGGRVLDEIDRGEIKSATEFLFSEMVAPLPDEVHAQEEDSLSQIADSIFEEAGVRDRSDWRGSTTVKCWVKDVLEEFPFSYVFGTDRKTSAVFQRVPIGRRQSVNNAAFMMEWIGFKVVKARSRRGAIIDTSAGQPTREQSIAMLGQFATVIDVADRQIAARKIIKAVGNQIVP